MSPQTILLLALLSAFSRAGLNLVDRYQIGRQQLSIAVVSFWNNAIPAILVVSLALLLGVHHALLSIFLEWRTALFSGLVQLVAYTFSNAFRHLTVTQVTVATKAADLFIPIAIFIAVGHWDWLTYGFAVVTTLICLPVLHRDSSPSRAGRMAIVLIAGVLILQAGLAPLLNRADGATPDLLHSLMFAAAVIVWRLLWCMPAMLGRKTGWSLPRSLLLSPLFITRVLLTLITQVTFILAISSAVSSVAWPVLNATGLLAMLLSSLLLKEKPSQPEQWAVAGITLLALLRFFTL